MTEVITVPQAARVLKLTPAALYLAIKKGQVASRRELDRIVIPLVEVDRLKQEKIAKGQRK